MNVINPSRQLGHFVNSCFSVLEHVNKFISMDVKLRTAELALDEHTSKSIFSCETLAD